MSDRHHPAFTFADGVLGIRAPLVEYRIRWRPEPLAEERSQAGRRLWKTSWPELRLLQPPPDNPAGASADPDPSDKACAFAAFRAELPAELVSLTQPFASHQWPLLLLLAGGGHGLDLARSNLLLAYALANNHEFRRTSIEAAAMQAARYVHRKQRTIVGWLGFPDSDAAANLLRKLPPGEASPALLRRLAGALRERPEVLPLLSSLPALNATVLELACNARIARAITPGLLRDVATHPPGSRERGVADVLHDAIVLLPSFDPARPLPAFRRVRRVLDFCSKVETDYAAHMRAAEAAAEAARREAERRAAAFARRKALAAARGIAPFPDPPVPGTETIQPLASDRDLRAESREQHNCVDALPHAVREGRLYLYRVLAPERATLSIAQRSDGSWRRHELQIRDNQPPSLATAQAVDAWLKQHALSI